MRWSALLLLSASLLAAEPAPLLTGWTYRLDGRPLADQYADPGGRLNDGETGRTKVVIQQGGDLTLLLELGAPCRVDEVRVFQYRHNLNYQLEELQVQAEQAGQWRPVAAVPGFVGPTPTMDFEHVIPLPRVETARLRLVFRRAGVLSLSEVQVRGVRAEAATTGAYATVPLTADPAPRASEADLDGDGRPEVILENAHARLILTPQAGGLCRSFRLKPSGVELVNSQNAGYGLLRDQFWTPNYSFGDRVYFHRLETGPAGASVELWATGTGGMMSFTEVRKRLTLGAAGPTVQVHYTITNEPSSQTDYEYGFWSHNWVGQLGAVNRYAFPQTGGVQGFELDPRAGDQGGDRWYRDPAQGWLAFASDQGHGLATLVPYRLLDLCYAWSGTGSLAATHEFRLAPVTLRAGEKLEFDLALLPLEHLTRVDGHADGVLASLDATVADGAVTAAVRAVQPRGYGAPHQIVVNLVTWPGREPVAPRDDEPLDLGPGGLFSGTPSWRGVPPGAYALQLEVRRDGRAVGRIEQPVSVGGVAVAWRLEPEGERVARRTAPAAAPGVAISTAVVTPHVAWAKPLPGGPIKTLVLCDDLQSREAVELAQRIDLDLDYTKFRTTLAKELLYQGDLSILTLEAAQQRLGDKLRANRYDLFVISGFQWGFHFSAENRQQILDAVRGGAGLILIQPDGFDAATARLLPVAGVAKAGNAARRMNSFFRWQPVADQPLAAGLDWARFPVTRRHEYDTPPQGQVVATSGDDGAPLVTLGSLGEGRVVAATWDVLTHELSYRGYAGLTPSIDYRGGWLRPEYANLPGDFAEAWYALLCRLVAWAAKRDSGVRLVAAEPVTVAAGQATATVEVRVASARAVAGARLRAAWLGPFEERRAQVVEPVALPAGETTLALPVATADLAPGPHAVWFTVEGPAGALAWGFTTVNVAAGPVALAGVVAEPDTLLPAGGVWQADGAVESLAFRPAQPVALRATLTAAAPAGATLVCDLVDSRGLRVARGEQAVPEGATTATLTIPPPTLVVEGLEARVTLRSGAAGDQRTVRLVAHRPRVVERFRLTSWGGDWQWRSKYLAGPLSRLVADYGIDVALEGENELGTGKVRNNAWHGIGHSWLGLLSYLGKDVPEFGDRDFAKKAGEYARTKDPQFLVRTPSLVDPAWREAVAAKLRERAQKTLPAGGTYDYCMGDEMSLTHYTQFHDYDWSPASLADFRRWLRGRYADLEALNRSWGTGFATWDAVLPLTREAAQAAANPAPWAEFRQYMNDQLADFYRFVQSTLREVDPHARCGLSGTQSPEAANGMEWWRLSQAFSFYHSYNTSWSNELRRSFQRYGGAAQSPYFAGYSAVNPDAEYRLWWCLFHDTVGISAWNTALFFNGDFTLSASGRDTRAHLEAFRDGIWRLLRAARRQHDGVAIHYSMPSILAAALTGEGQRLNAARDTWVKLLEDLGLQYEFVAAEQVAEGLLDRGEFKILVLPWAPALSDPEVAAIRRFVAAGGTVVADRRPGERDELCRPRSPGALDDLFGLRVEGQPVALDPRVKVTSSGAELRVPVLATNLRAAGATVLATGADGQTPAVLQGGGGRALLVNLDLSDFESDRRFHSPTERGLRALVGPLLARAGVQPRYPVTLDDGRPAQVEVVRYQLDQVEYLCLLNAERKAGVATIELGRECQVYDVRRGADRGRLSRLTVPLDPLGARVYALSTDPLPAFTALAATRPDALRVSLAPGNGAPRRLVRLTVTDPRGQVRPELRQTIWLSTARVEATVPLGLDEADGAWTVAATDVTTGQAVPLRATFAR